MNRVPKATRERYPIYLKVFRLFKSEGKSEILSQDLQLLTNIKATTIRKDFAFLGSLGKQGVGYNIDAMIERFEQELGLDHKINIVLIGVGNIGKALLKYNNWQNVVGEIKCAFDINPSVIEEMKNNEIKVYHIDELEQRLDSSYQIAIITASQVQEVVNRLINIGVKAIVDFTNEHFSLPSDVVVKRVDVVSSIQEVAFALKKQEE